jgi:hypothetical protein
MTTRFVYLAALGVLGLREALCPALAAAPLAPFNTEPSATRPMPAVETAQQVWVAENYTCLEQWPLD